MLCNMRKITFRRWLWSEVSLFRLQTLLWIAGAGTAATGTHWGRLLALHSRLVVKLSPRAGVAGSKSVLAPVFGHSWGTGCCSREWRSWSNLIQPLVLDMSVGLLSLVQT